MLNGDSISSSYWIKVLLSVIVAFNWQILFADINPEVVAELNRSNSVPKVHSINRIPDLIEAANTFSGTPQKMALIDLGVTIRKIKVEKRQKVLVSISALLSRNDISVKLSTATLLKDWSSELSPTVRKTLISSMNSISSSGSPTDVANANRILAHFRESPISNSPDTFGEDRSAGPQSSNQAVHAPLSGQAWLELFSDELTLLKAKDKATAERVIRLALSGQQRQAQTLLQAYRGKVAPEKDNIQSWIKTFERESKSWPEFYERFKEEILQNFKQEKLEQALAIFNTVKIQIANSKNWIDTNSTKLAPLEIYWESEVFDLLSISRALDQKYANVTLAALSSLENTRSEHTQFLKSRGADLNSIEASTNISFIDLKEPKFGQTLAQLESRFSQIPLNSIKGEPEHEENKTSALDIKLSRRFWEIFQAGLLLLVIIFVFESLISTSPGKSCFGLFNSGTNSFFGVRAGLCIRFLIKYCWFIGWVLMKIMDAINKDEGEFLFGQQSLLQDTPILFFLTYCLINLITLFIKGSFLHDIIGGTSVQSSIDRPTEKNLIPMAFGRRIEKASKGRNSDWDEDDNTDMSEKPADGPFELRYDDGTLEASGYLSEGNLDGKITYYNPNGRISRTSFYAAGKLHGPTTTFNENEQPILYESYINGNQIIEHSRGTFEFWLSKSTICLEFGLGRRLTAFILDYNFCLLSAGSAKFFEINLPVIYGVFFLIPIIPELVTGT